MFLAEEDLTLHITRGDAGEIVVRAIDETTYGGETPYIFKAGEVLRFTVCEKKNCRNIVLQKDFPVLKDAETVTLTLEEADTKIGDTISKPVDYWYEVELNPFTEPQTIIGYDEDGAKIFRLYPEGQDIEVIPPTPEELGPVDKELSLTSQNAIQNQAVTRAIVQLKATVTKHEEEITTLNSKLNLESKRITNLASLKDGSTSGDAELTDIRIGMHGTVYGSAGESVRGQFNRLYSDISDSLGSRHYLKDITNLLTIDNGYYTDTGGIVGNESSQRTELFSVSFGEEYRISGSYGYGSCLICEFGENKNFLNAVGTSVDSYVIAEDYVYSPSSGVSYIGVSSRSPMGEEPYPLTVKQYVWGFNDLNAKIENLDAETVRKEEGKGLSTNDFTTAEKEKLAKALLPENIDQTYSATSENAQSGLAVAQALENKPITKVDTLIVENAEEGLYLTKEVKRNENLLYSSTFPFLVLIGEPIAVIGQQPEKDVTLFTNDEIFKFTSGVRSAFFDERITANSINAPTTQAVKNYVDASIDQTYSPESTNAQSGVAVAQELGKKLSHTGGNMSGNLGMGNNDILNVKRIVFSGDNKGQWLNMSNCPITNVGEPTADNHAATKKYVDNRISGGGGGYESGYEYVTMLDTTLSEEVTTIDIDKINNKTLNCIEFYAQLDVPNASSVKEIRFNVKRANNSYQGVTTEIPTLKTTTDSAKHTLVAVKFTQNGSIFWNSFYGGQIANKNISWNTPYPSVAIYTHSGSSNNINADGTTGIRISGLFPSGTIVKVYGKCKLA